MSDHLAERLKAHAGEQQRRKQAETEPRSPEQQSLQMRGEAFISEHALSEYEHLVDLLKERAEKIRSETRNSPEIVVTGSYIQLGHVALHYRFDRPSANPPKNELVLSIGLAPYKHVISGGNTYMPVHHKLEAGAAQDCTRILWVNSQGVFDSAELAEFALDMLTHYYCRHTKK
jgi:hypothetical protein